MRYQQEQIMALDNPYRVLNQSKDLAENSDTLNQLKPEDKLRLATKLIHNCPNDKLKEFRNQFRVLESFRHDKPFYRVMASAYSVKQSINSLLDVKNSTPHLLFLDTAFNASLFHEFKTLASLSMQGKESAIAEILAVSTPKYQHSVLAKNIALAFPDSLLSQQLGAALTLRQQIDSLLLGNNPDAFFSSPDFNEQLCQAFPRLIAVLIKGHEPSIGAKLLGSNQNTRDKLMLQPFKPVFDCMIAREDIFSPRTGFFGTTNKIKPNPEGIEDISSDEGPSNFSDISEDEAYDSSQSLLGS